jgi:hypothetical protein
MRKLIVSLTAAATITIGAVAALQAGAAASTTFPVPPGEGTGQAAHLASHHSQADISFTTRMIAYKAIDVPPAGLSPGDYYVIAGRVISHGRTDGLSTAQCTYTMTSGPILRVCTVDYAVNNGLIIASGYINGSAPGHAVTLIVDGGNGPYRDARGYGTLQPTATGSDVTLHLTS